MTQRVIGTCICVQVLVYDAFLPLLFEHLYDKYRYYYALFYRIYQFDS